MFGLHLGNLSPCSLVVLLKRVLTHQDEKGEVSYQKVKTPVEATPQLSLPIHDADGALKEVALYRWLGTCNQVGKSNSGGHLVYEGMRRLPDGSTGVAFMDDRKVSRGINPDPSREEDSNVFLYQFEGTRKVNNSDDFSEPLSGGGEEDDIEENMHTSTGTTTRDDVLLSKNALESTTDNVGVVSSPSFASKTSSDSETHLAYRQQNWLIAEKEHSLTQEFRQLQGALSVNISDDQAEKMLAEYNSPLENIKDHSCSQHKSNPETRYLLINNSILRAREQSKGRFEVEFISSIKKVESEVEGKFKYIVDSSSKQVTKAFMKFKCRPYFLRFLSQAAKEATDEPNSANDGWLLFSDVYDLPFFNTLRFVESRPKPGPDRDYYQLRTSSGKVVSVYKTFFHGFKRPASNGQTFAPDFFTQEEGRRDSQNSKFVDLKPGSIANLSESAIQVIESMEGYIDVDFSKPNPFQQKGKMDRSCQRVCWGFPLIHTPGCAQKTLETMKTLENLATIIPSRIYDSTCRELVQQNIGPVVRIETFDPLNPEHRNLLVSGPVVAQWRDEPHYTAFFGEWMFEPSLGYAVKICIHNLNTLFDGGYHSTSFKKAYRLTGRNKTKDEKRMMKRERAVANRGEHNYKHKKPKRVKKV